MIILGTSVCVLENSDYASIISVLLNNNSDLFFLTSQGSTVIKLVTIERNKNLLKLQAYECYDMIVWLSLIPLATKASTDLYVQ